MADAIASVVNQNTMDDLLAELRLSDSRDSRQWWRQFKTYLVVFLLAADPLEYDFSIVKNPLADPRILGPVLADPPS